MGVFPVADGEVQVVLVLVLVRFVLAVAPTESGLPQRITHDSAISIGITHFHTANRPFTMSCIVILLPFATAMTSLFSSLFLHSAVLRTPCTTEY